MTASVDREVAPVLIDPTARPVEPWNALGDLLDVFDSATAYDPIGFSEEPTPAPLWLDAQKFAQWVDRHFPAGRLAKLNGLGDDLARWRSGQVRRIHYATADRLLIAIGGFLPEVPADLYLRWRDLGP